MSGPRLSRETRSLPWDGRPPASVGPAVLLRPSRGGRASVSRFSTVLSSGQEDPCFPVILRGHSGRFHGKTCFHLALRGQGRLGRSQMTLGETQATGASCPPSPARAALRLSVLP